MAPKFLDCKTVGFFLKISKEIGKVWRKRLTRAKCASLTRPYLNTQKYGLFCSLQSFPSLASSRIRLMGHSLLERQLIKLPRRCCKELSLATSCLRSSTENDFRTRFLLVIIKRTFLELAWKRSEHLIVSEAPNNKTANCFH